MGVYMQDQKIPLKNGTFIINNDIMSNKGIHWCAGVIQGKTIYIYDSFGRRSRNLLPIFTQQMKMLGYKIKNTDLSDRDQNGTKSVDCGHRSVSALKIYKEYGLQGYMKL